MSTHAEHLVESLALPPRARANLAEEADLFGLFVNAVSAIDCLVYAAYTLGSIRRRNAFPMETEDDLRFIRFDTTADRFRREYPERAITGRLLALKASRSYRRLRNTRNLLAHRAGIRRTVTISMSGERVTWGTGDRPGDGDVELTPEYVRAIQQITTAWVWRMACGLDAFTEEFFQPARR